MSTKCNSRLPVSRRLSGSDWLVFSTSTAGLIIAGCALGGAVLPLLQMTYNLSVGQAAGAVIGGVAGLVLCSADFFTRPKRH